MDRETSVDLDYEYFKRDVSGIIVCPDGYLVFSDAAVERLAKRCAKVTRFKIRELLQTRAIFKGDSVRVDYTLNFGKQPEMKTSDYILNQLEVQKEYVLAVERGYGFTHHGNVCHYLFRRDQVFPELRETLPPGEFFIWSIKGGSLSTNLNAPAKITACPSAINWTNQVREIRFDEHDAAKESVPASPDGGPAN